MIRIEVPGQPIAKGRAVNRKATDAEIILAYEALGSCVQAGKALGMCGQSVHERLVKLGANKSRRKFTEAECDRLRLDYNDYVSRGDLDKLAGEMGRTRHYLCRQARALGLTDMKRTGKTPFEVASAAAKRRLEDNGHPRGFAGRKHSEKTKDRLSQTSTETWKRMTPDQRAHHTIGALRRKVEIYGSVPGTKSGRGSWKAGWREIGGKRNYYRSRWEANYARYLEWLKQRGEIKDWQHEPETFWFDAIKRGVRSYLPDFRVWENNDTSRLHEVKGWMCPRSKTTLRRMKKYHPQETIVVIERKQYDAIARTAGRMIEGWETSGRAGRE